MKTLLTLILKTPAAFYRDHIMLKQALRSITGGRGVESAYWQGCKFAMEQTWPANVLWKKDTVPFFYLEILTATGRTILSVHSNCRAFLAGLENSSPFLFFRFVSWKKDTVPFFHLEILISTGRTILSVHSFCNKEVSSKTVLVWHGSKTGLWSIRGIKQL